MSQFRTVEIDFDVHKCIENERGGFQESPNTALRRLLGLPPSPTASINAEHPPTLKQPWTDNGVMLPHGTSIRFHYDRRRQSHDGMINDGKWVFRSGTFDSPSTAASELAVTKKGRKTKLNGWLYFDVKDAESGKWVPLDDLRHRRHAPMTAEQMGL